MPAISLVVCVHEQRDLLARLLSKTQGLYDDLVVVHDGPEDESESQVEAPTEVVIESPAIDYATLASGSPLPDCYITPAAPSSGSIHQLTNEYAGCYFEGPHCFQQEPHWPFAWSRAKYDWILRLDADEFPSAELRDWLRNFRAKADADPVISGYTCIWPVWNGTYAITKRWPASRNFLFHRRRVRFISIPEQTVIADTVFEPLPLTLHHQPARRSHGIRNVLVRKQASNWRSLIVRALLGSPLDLPRWRWNSEEWPERWAEVRRHPLRTACTRLIFDSLRTFRDQWKVDRRVYPGIGLSGPIHHALFSFEFWRLHLTRSHRNRKDDA